MKILANDGISPEGKERLENAGFTVVTETVKQEDLVDTINQENYVALIVRSATQVRKDIIDGCPNLKFIGRGGVGMDNIDVEYAESKGKIVRNTPASSSQSVAELVTGTLFSLARTTFDSYKKMPESGDKQFKELKKKYGKGIELRGKTLLIIGFGKIGQSLAGYALGLGMNVIASDQFEFSAEIPIHIDGVGLFIRVIKTTTDFTTELPKADFISLHVPKQEDGSSVITKKEFDLMKDGVRIVNMARGGVMNEEDLIEALDSGKVAAAAIDVFENEPTPNPAILQHPKIACTPHVGAATMEAQKRIGVEMANIIISELK